jgi:hypothetical protein
MKLEKIVSNHLSDKGLIPKYIKYFNKLIAKRPNDSILNMGYEPIK